MGRSVAEQEAGQGGMGVVLAGGRVQAAEVLQDRLVVGQQRRPLVQQGDGDGEPHLAGGRRQRADGQSDHGRLAGPVRSRNRHPLGPRDAERQALNHRRSVRPGEGDVLEAQHRPPFRQAGRRQVEAQGPGALDAGFGRDLGLRRLGRQLVGQLAFARAAVLGPLGHHAEQDLRLAALGGELAAGGVAAVLALAGDLGLAGDTADLLLGVVEIALRGVGLGGLSLGIEIPATAIGACAQGRQLDDAVHAAKQGPVVADHHHAAAPAGQHPGHDRLGLDVEIVGRLVQQQHVGTRDQQPRQACPRRLAARQRRRRSLRIEPCQTDIGQRLVQSRRQVPVGFGKVGLVALPALDARQAIPGRADAQQVGQSRAVRDVRRLVQGRDGPRPRDRPAQRRTHASDQRQQGRLARAVAPDQADTFGPDREVQIFEKQPAVRRGGGNGIQSDEGHANPRSGKREGRSGLPSC